MSTLTSTPLRRRRKPSEPAHLYESVADRIAGLIDRGTLRPGQRVPSVRKLSAQLSVSVSTVLQAYRILEDRGRIEARPQSGYYVRPPLSSVLPAVPGVSRPSRQPTRVSVGNLVVEMLKACADPQVVPLGGAIPPPACLPTRQLNRLQGAIGRRLANGGNYYDVPPGCKELRVQIARRYLEAGCALSPDDVVTTCGCQEALGLCLRAVAKPGDVIAIESPTFYGHLQTIEAVGMRALEVPTCPNEGVDLDALRRALDGTRVRACLFVTNCQNPLGSVMPDARKRELVELLAARDVPLIEDDIYGDLAFADRGRPKVCKAWDAAGNVLLCSSFSKTLAPGARVGWCAPGRWRDEVEKLKVCTTLATPTLPQLAIAEYLASGGYDHHVRRVRKYYAEQVRLTSAAVQRAFPEGTRVTRPAGGYVLWVEMPGHVDAERLYERAAERKINVAPGPIFSSQPGKYRNFVRLNCAYPYGDVIERAIFTLGRLAGEG